MREAAHPPCRVRSTRRRGGAWRFGRPHTVIGTSVGIVAIYAVAVADLAGGDLTVDLFDLACVLLAGWCVNVFIVGINQLEDVEIDRINKPELPIAAGELSVRLPGGSSRCAPSCRSRWRSPRGRRVGVGGRRAAHRRRLLVPARVSSAARWWRRCRSPSCAR